MDSSPVVFITCNVSENLIGKDAFQEVDITGIAMPITKCQLSGAGRRRPSGRRDARRPLPLPGHRPARPGADRYPQKRHRRKRSDYEPLPREEHANRWPSSAHADRRRQPRSASSRSPIMSDVDTLAEMIAQAEKPAAASAAAAWSARPRPPGIPEVCREAGLSLWPSTVMGGGGFPGGNPLTTGMIGMHGSQASNMACDQLRPAHCRGLPLLRPGGPGPRDLCQPGQNRPDRH